MTPLTEPLDVGFLGLGRMGGAMAERLLGKPFRLHVHDPSPRAAAPFLERGAIGHDSPRAVADAATIVFACLPGQSVSIDAALGDAGAIHGSAIRWYAEMSTIGQRTVGRIAEGLDAARIGTIDAPVTGGPPAAREGRLTMLVSGTPDGVAAVRPLLATMGRAVHVMGDRPGLAQAMKVVNNLIMAANVVVACEGLALGTRAGLDPGLMLQVLRVGTGHSVAANDIVARAVGGRFDFGAALSILDKDVMLGLEEAAALGAEIPVIDQARATWHAAYEAGMGDQDFTTILKFVELANRTLVRAVDAGAH